jgi:hypothetical protein
MLGIRDPRIGLAGITRMRTTRTIWREDESARV